MENRFVDVKKIIIRHVALWISFFYIINPIYKPLHTMLHSLTHNLDIPSFVVEHQVIEIQDYTVHKTHAHDKNVFHHDHGILSAFSTLFEAFNNQNDDHNSQISTFAIDKHFFSEIFSFEPLIIIYRNSSYSDLKFELQRGHKLSFLRPPIFLIS